MLSVVFLWHMHQPNYVNSLTQTAVMPWVRLHAAKGYLDMITVARDYQEVKMNFNFTPVLLMQMEALVQKKVTDLWETWSRKPVEMLSAEEKMRILENFFKIHHENCIFPHQRYRSLLNKRGTRVDAQSLRNALERFSDQDFLDLQVFYNLAWCGFSAQKLYPELTELKKKGEDFTEADKNRVLDIHGEILAQVIGLYRKAMEAGQIELTTTPFFHPIMPLVYDTDFAQRCMPKRTLPPRFSAPEDVSAQLRLAQEMHERFFGKKARGLWPSEGSICPEILPLLKEAGIEYFCSDEQILFQSLKNDPVWRQKSVDHLELFQGWVCEHGDARITAFFREHPLSDFIGFSAARSSAEEASDYLLHHIEHIATVAPQPGGMLCIALDGENEWEAFPDGGEAFLHKMYQKLAKNTKAKTKRLGDYVDEKHRLPTTSTLHTGSWIGSSFDIWIGDEEENDAWNILRQARQFLVKEEQTGKVRTEVLEKAWREIYAAEGSDWFWWYGPDFESDNDLLFDELFRTHLQNVYRLLETEPPSHLAIPICQPANSLVASKAFDFISPRLDGEELSYFEWLGAGRIDVLKQQATAMFASDRNVKQIWYGFNEDDLFFRLDFIGKLPDKVAISFHDPKIARLVIEGKHALFEQPIGNKLFEQEKESQIQVAAKKCIEVKVPLKILDWYHSDVKISFSVQIFQNGVEKESYPQRGFFEFYLPSPQFKLENWFV